MGKDLVRGDMTPYGGRGRHSNSECGVCVLPGGDEGGGLRGTVRQNL